MKSKFGNRDYLSNNVGIYNKSKKKTNIYESMNLIE